MHRRGASHKHGHAGRARRLAARLALALVAAALAAAGASAAGAKDRSAASFDTSSLNGFGKAPSVKAHSRASRKERARSRTKFRKLSTRPALRVARAAFPADVGRTPWRGLQARSGERVKGYPTRNSALVDTGATDAVVTSTFPLVTEDREVVDLALTENDGTLTPKTPLLPLKISRSPRKGAVVGTSGLGIRPAGGAGATGTVVEGKVFYANVDTDTDLIVEPTVSGVETFHQLRSAASPEKPALDMRLPRGTQLRSAGAALPGSLEVVRGDERVVLIDPPAAMDADGRPVPVKYELDGSRLVLDVPHRSGSYRYPILVDPDAHVWEDFRGWPDTKLWEPTSYGNFAWGWSGNSPFSNAALGCAECHYGAGQWHQFRWPTTKGTNPPYAQDRYRNAFLFRADTSVDYQPNGSRLTQGFWPDYGWELATTGGLGGTTNTFCLGGHCGGRWPNGARNGTDGNFFYHSLEITVPGWRYGAFSKLNWALLYTHEMHPPSVGATTWTTGTDAPVDTGGWLGANRTIKAKTPVSDVGLGIRQAELVRRVGGSLATPSTRTIEPCYGGVGPHDTSPDYNGGPWHGQTTPGPDQGDRNHQCEMSKDFTWSLNTNDLPEGTNHLGVDGYDIVGQKSNPTNNSSYLKVDRQGPELDVSGPLRDDGQVDIDGSQLWVTAFDGDETTLRSGVASIEIKVNGARQDFISQACPEGSCDLDRRFKLRTPGTHTIQVIALDHAGNSSSESWSVTVTNSPEPVDTEPEPPQASAQSSKYDCTLDPTELLVGDVKEFTTGVWTGGVELTEWLASDTYRITRCAFDGKVAAHQTVQQIAIPGGTAWAPVEKLALNTDGTADLIQIKYGSPASPEWVAEWNAVEAEVRAETLPATTGARTANPSYGGDVQAAASDTCSFRKYKLAGYKWPTRTYTFRVNRGTMPGSKQSTRDLFLASILQGHQTTWNDTFNGCGYKDRPNFTIAYDGTATSASALTRDGQNTRDFGSLRTRCNNGVACHIARFPKGPDGEFDETVIAESDMRLNSRIPFWPYSGRRIKGSRCVPRTSGTCYDTWGTTAHEAGHSLGLDHVKSRTQTMYSGGNYIEEFHYRSLARSDVKAFWKLYP